MAKVRCVRAATRHDISTYSGKLPIYPDKICPIGIFIENVLYPATTLFALIASTALIYEASQALVFCNPSEFFHRYK